MMLGPNDWWVIVGAGAIWLGIQIVIVGRLPRALRRGPQPSAPKGSPEAFGLFWLDQYGTIGISLAVGGLLAVFRGAVG